MTKILEHFRPVTGIFYGGMRFNEETDQTKLEAYLSKGGGGLLGRQRLRFDRFERFEKHGVFFSDF